MKKKQASTVKKHNELERKCTRDFFFKKYKEILRVGSPEIASLGMEASLEACEGLFEDGSLVIKAFDIAHYFIFLKHKNNNLELIYSSEEN